MTSFYTEVIEHDARFDSAKRIDDLALLEPVTRGLVTEIIRAAAFMGFDLAAFETYRSQARQRKLFAEGTTQLKKVGVHHYGLACDLVKRVGGELTWKGDYSFLGELARSAGLIWGGDWGTPERHHTFIDSVHVQRCTVARQPLLFAGEWYPEDDYNPYEDVDQPVLFSVTRNAIEAGAAMGPGSTLRR